jgi:hypothetical protein
MTTLDVTLSPALLTDLTGKTGAYLEAVYFNAGTMHQTLLVNDGTVAGSGTVDITLPSAAAQKIYFLTQSIGTSDPPPTISSAITAQSQINPSNATSLDFGYDSFEVSLTNAPGDVGNLTAVNGFGLPMAIQVVNSSGTESVGYAASGSTIAKAISTLDPSAILTFSQGPLSGDFRMAESPATLVGQSGTGSFSASYWNNYISNLEGPQADSIELSGEYNGAGAITPGGETVWHNGGYFAYQLHWDSVDQAFWLDPMPNSQIQGDIEITPTQLANSIYSTLGSVDIYAPGAGAEAPQLYISGMNVGANNQWGKVLTDFLTGFTAGFYDNGGGKSLNPQVTSAVDLNNNANWDPNYAFESNLAGTAPGFVTYDPYSKIFFDESNSYGSGYSDALMQQYAVGGPLLSMWNGTSDVSSIDLTIFANTETPTGYTTPEIHDYIAPTDTTESKVPIYVVPTDTTSGANIGLSFAASVTNNAGVVLAGTASITLNILTSDTNATPVWTTVTLDGATAGSDGLWQNWALKSNGSGGYTATATPANQPVGSMLITGLPIADNGVSWYQIGVGSKTFNLYTTSLNGAFENPAYTGQQNALAVDGLAVIQTPAVTTQTINTFNIDFASAQAVTYSSSLMAPLSAADSATAPTPAAPVAGTMSNTQFTPLPGQNNLVSNTVTTDSQSLAFAWTGENSSPNTSSWISGYTNKIDGLDIANVSITPVSGIGSTFDTTGTANIDGEWQTGTVAVTPGTYDVTMTEYQPGGSTPLTNASTPLVLVETAPPPCFASGTPIRTVAGDVPVERLTPGTVLPTAAGRGTARVIWVGHRTVDCRRHRRPETVMPVRVCRDAFAPGRPQADLLLSPDHAVFVDGVLIPVRHLVNGATIRRQPCDLVTYFHVELDRHDVLLAAGLPAESYLDTGNRGTFANGGAAPRRSAAFARKVWATGACAPLVQRGRRLLAVRRALLARAAACGHIVTAAADLRVLADDRVVDVMQDGPVWHVPLPPGTGTVRLVSRTWCPAEVIPHAIDQRRLGVAVAGLLLDGRAASLTSPGLGAGWHAPEPGRRWTDGNGTLAIAGTRQITFALAMTGSYWHHHPPA